MLSSIDSVTAQVTMENGSHFSYPPSWKASLFNESVWLQGPEQDFDVYFVISSLSEEAIENAWLKVKPEFNLKISQQLTYPPTWCGGFWESVENILYDVPLSEGRSVMAIYQVYKEEAYIILIDAKTAALQRRGSEYMQMMGSWKPAKVKEPNLNNSEVKKWNKQETAEFETFIHKGMEALQIPGFAIVIVQRDGKTLFSGGYGVKKLGTHDIVTVDTPFMIGSTTKALTTLVMAALVDRNKLKWEQPVIEILHDFKLGDDDLTKQLTARLTVSASTGMPRRDFDFIFNYSHITPEVRLSQMRHMKPTTKLGETFQYSNLLFTVGGYMAGRAFKPIASLQEAYADAMKSLVLDPLDMKNSVLTLKEAQALQAAHPHSIDIDGNLSAIDVNLENSCASIAPSGALWSSVNDMSHYLLMELNQGEWNSRHIVSQANLLERRIPGIKMGDKSFYGLGLILSSEQGLQMVGHGGGTMGFASDLFFYPEKEIGVVMMTNSRYGHSFLSAVKQKFLELTFGAQPQSEEIIKHCIALQKETIRKVKNDLSLDSEKLAWINDYVDEYYNDYLGETKIVATSDGFEILCQEWHSRIGVEVDQNQKKYLVLIDPPFPGLLKLQINEKGDLLLDAGQEQYVFKKKNKVYM